MDPVLVGEPDCGARWNSDSNGYHKVGWVLTGTTQSGVSVAIVARKGNTMVSGVYL